MLDLVSYSMIRERCNVYFISLSFISMIIRTAHWHFINLKTNNICISQHVWVKIGQSTLVEVGYVGLRPADNTNRRYIL